MTHYKRKVYGVDDDDCPQWRLPANSTRLSARTSGKDERRRLYVVSRRLLPVTADNLLTLTLIMIECRALRDDIWRTRRAANTGL